MTSKRSVVATFAILSAMAATGVVGATTVVDLDGDGVPAITELQEGTDPLAADSDDDGLDDDRELELGTDPTMGDTDRDGLVDSEELERGADPTDADSDGDGLDDGTEVHEVRTDPAAADTDGDGLDDREEVEEYETDPTDADSDDDGLEDDAELERGTDPSDEDTDGDGLTDGREIDRGTDPRETDTDDDGLLDGEEVAEYESDPTDMDSDDDGLDDGPEVENDADPTDPDTDDDGLTDGAEIHEYHSDPTATDTDDDGLDDAEEVREYGTDPGVADTDDDGLRDRAELTEYGTDPLVADTDDDGLEDGVELATDSPIADADPLRKDVFVEIDYMEGQKPAMDELQRVVEAYDDAPVENPDGSTGVDLHLVLDEEISPMDDTDADDRDRLMSMYMDREDQGYHYAIAVVDARFEGEDRNGFSAIEYNNGAFVFEATGGDSEVKTFMHELGHSVGIGSDDYVGVDSRSIPYSEYSSVMNYNHDTYDDPLKYSDSDPFDDWEYVDERLYTPGTALLEPKDSESE